MNFPIAIEKRGKNLVRFFEIISKQTEVLDKELKKKVSKSSYYKVVLAEVYKINQLIRHFEPNSYFCMPDLHKDQNGNVLKTLKRNPNIEIEDFNGFYLLKFNDHGEQATRETEGNRQGSL